MAKKPPPQPKAKTTSSDDVSTAPKAAAEPEVDAVVASGPDGEAVQVVVRMRPFNTKEKNENRGPCIDLDLKLRQVG
jgi:hypothetical protein